MNQNLVWTYLVYIFLQEVEYEGYTTLKKLGVDTNLNLSLNEEKDYSFQIHQIKIRFKINHNKKFRQTLNVL